MGCGSNNGRTFHPSPTFSWCKVGFGNIILWFHSSYFVLVLSLVHRLIVLKSIARILWYCCSVCVGIHWLFRRQNLWITLLCRIILDCWFLCILSEFCQRLSSFLHNFKPICWMTTSVDWNLACFLFWTQWSRRNIQDLCCDWFS